MPVMLERWNDERMDDLAAKVDGIGVQLREQRSELRGQIDATRGELRGQIDATRGETKAGFEKVDRELHDHRMEMLELRRDMKGGLERIDERFERVDERFGKLERTMTQAAIALSSSVIVGFGTLLAAQL